MSTTWNATRGVAGTEYQTTDGRFFVMRSGRIWTGFASVPGTGFVGTHHTTATAARAEVESFLDRLAVDAENDSSARRSLTISDFSDTLTVNDNGSGNVILRARDEHGVATILITRADRRALAAFLLDGIDEPTDAEIAEHEDAVDRSIEAHEIRIAVEDEEPIVDEHNSRVYVDDQNAGTYAYSCSCGAREGGYLVGPYARDGWREAHGLDPLVNRPLV